MHCSDRNIPRCRPPTRAGDNTAGVIACPSTLIQARVAGRIVNRLAVFQDLHPPLSAPRPPPRGRRTNWSVPRRRTRR